MLMEKFIRLLAETRIRIVIIIFLIIFSTLIFFISRKEEDKTVVTSADQTVQSSPQPSVPDIDAEILKNALNVYIEKRVDGVDLKDGPCLGMIADDWVLDIVHDPRTPVDDLVENQCEEFREGQVHHFIELDPSGQLIRSF